QDEKEVTFAWNVSKEEEKIDIHEGYQKIHNHIRALSPYIGAYVCMDGKKVKLWASRKTTLKSEQPDGTVIGFANKAMQVVFDNTVLEITELQPEGKGKMDAVSFANGLGKQWIHKQFE
ncbi:MAG: methionyl-tRNA formyltransferase, partial [Erysipelotrichaceae bacterium]|nr:methionyl-tRNA formyltransferase [Erysipelotrichaceae bacterium]